MKLNLLKKLLTLSPVVISPILVTACGSTDDTRKTKHASFYLEYYSRELNTLIASQNSVINAVANSPNHNYDMKLEVLDKVLAKVEADGKKEYQKEFANSSDYNGDIFYDVVTSFSIPDDSSGIFKLNGNTLSVYPTSVANLASNEKHINYSLTLKNSKLNIQPVTGTLKINLAGGFVNFGTGNSNDVTAVYGNTNLSTVLVGTESGIQVGVKQNDGKYKFTTYDDSNGLSDNYVEDVYGNADMSKIMVGEDSEGGAGGLDVGTRQPDGSYKFKNYSTSSSGSKLANDTVLGLYGDANMSKILVGEDTGGLDVGNESGGNYTFKNYTNSNGLNNNIVESVYGDIDLSTILVGERGGGLDVGNESGGAYSFKNYSTKSTGSEKLKGDTVKAVFGSANMSSVFVGEDGTGIDVGTKNGSVYNFTNYSTSSTGKEKLTSNDVKSIYGNSEMSKILVGEEGGGLDVGTKGKDGKYTFVNYKTSTSPGKLKNNRVTDIYGNADLSRIVFGEFGGGIDISSNLWFA